MKRGVLFKTKRIEMEWPNIHPALRDRLTLLADYVNREFGKSFTITCLTRTPEENQKVGGKTDSLHVVNPTRAADIRTRTWIEGKAAPLYTATEIVAILDFWRKGGRGFGGQEERDHCHLQVKP